MVEGGGECCSSLGPVGEEDGHSSCVPTRHPSAVLDAQFSLGADSDITTAIFHPDRVSKHTLYS